MRSIWNIAANDLRLMLTERASFVMRLLIPVAFIIVVGIANDAFQTGTERTWVLDIVDLDGTALSGFTVDYLADHASDFDITRSADDPDGRLDSGEADFAVVVPHGFSASIAEGVAARVELRLAVSDPQQATRLESLLEAAGGRVGAAVRAEDVAADVARGDEALKQAASAAAQARAAELLRVDRITMERRPIELPDRHELIGFQQSVPGMGSMFVMLTVLAGATLLIEERTRYTLQRTMIAPVSRAAFISGKVLGRFVVGMMQYVVAIVTGLVIGVVVGIDFGSSPFLMLIVMVSFALCAAAMSVLIAALVRRTQQASGLQTFLAVTLAPLGGAWWSLDIEIIPPVMRKIALVSPFYWVMGGFRAAIHDLGWQAAWLPVTVLLGFTAVLVSIAALRFRVE